MENEGTTCASPTSKRTIVKRTIVNCDQAAWILDALKRHEMAVKMPFPSVSRLPEMARYAAVLEIIEILNLELDEGAKYNMSPIEFRRAEVAESYDPPLNRVELKED